MKLIIFPSILISPSGSETIMNCRGDFGGEDHSVNSLVAKSLVFNADHAPKPIANNPAKGCQGVFKVSYLITSYSYLFAMIILMVFFDLNIYFRRKSMWRTFDEGSRSQSTILAINITKSYPL